MVKEPKYVVTAVNRLTGEREEVSLPMALDKASALLMKARRSARRQKGTGHHRYRVERFVPQEGVLPFAPPVKQAFQSVRSVNLYIRACTFPRLANTLSLQTGRKGIMRYD
jgi:hypothetical protein